MAHFLVYSDGGARGNPGPAAIGIVIKKEGKTVAKISQTIGETTNNQAEYKAVIEGLKKLKELDPSPGVEWFVDSELIAEQLNGRYKVKNEGLKELFWQVRDLIISLGGRVVFKSIPRRENREADKLVNKALDSK